MPDKIGIGFIGTGFARSTQIPGFRNTEGAALVSVASGNVENAKSTAQEFGIHHFTDDWRETAAHPDVDLVCITTPPNLHREMALFSVSEGKHILCEKPMAMNANETRVMTEAASKAGVLALIDHELRFLNGRRRAFEIVREGGLGKIIHAKSFFRNASRGNPDLKWNWWSDEIQGGGALGAIGSHVVDGFRWLLETEIRDVSCLLKTNVRTRPGQDGEPKKVTTDDECNLIFRFKDSDLTDNASGTVSISLVEIGEYDFWIEIYGTEGSLVIGEKGDLKIAKRGESEFSPIDIELGEPPEGTRKGGWSIGFLAFAREIVQALQSGSTTVSGAATFEDGHEIQKVLDAARESSRTGSRVAIG